MCSNIGKCECHDEDGEEKLDKIVVALQQLQDSQAMYWQYARQRDDAPNPYKRFLSSNAVLCLFPKFHTFPTALDSNASSESEEEELDPLEQML
ncbi:hypothetical protein V6N13_029798 [Hibiscus sabdariffa]